MVIIPCVTFVEQCERSEAEGHDNGPGSRADGAGLHPHPGPRDQDTSRVSHCTLLS